MVTVWILNYLLLSDKFPKLSYRRYQFANKCGLNCYNSDSNHFASNMPATRRHYMCCL